MAYCVLVWKFAILDDCNSPLQELSTIGACIHERKLKGSQRPIVINCFFFFRKLILFSLMHRVSYNVIHCMQLFIIIIIGRSSHSTRIRIYYQFVICLTITVHADRIFNKKLNLHEICRLVFIDIADMNIMEM